jgi:DNA-binding NarL/FixJ family response regulator
VLDPHPLWLRGIAEILEEMQIEVLGAVTTPDAAADLIRRSHPSLFIIEPTVKDADGSWMQHIASARKVAPELKVVAFSDDVADETVAEALACGAAVFGSKSLDQEDIKAAIRQAFKPTIFHAKNLVPHPALDEEGEQTEDDALLTRREREVLQLAAQGMTNAQMAGQLWVSEETVKFHLSNTYRKISVKNRTQASRWAAEHGLIHLDRPNGNGANGSNGELDLQAAILSSSRGTDDGATKRS